MFRTLLKLVVVVVLLAAAAAFFLGYRIGDDNVARPAGAPVATTGKPDVDTTKARETGAAIGEKVATSANEAQRALAEMSLQGKIKSKMALDELVKASAINIDSAKGVVTLTGTVRSEAERARAVQLARETAGVTSVVDRLVVR
jgi:hyperosmotically inducible periplasmic protein